MHPHDLPATARPLTPSQLDAHWMPFTASRQLKADPRLLVEAQGCHDRDGDGRQVFDGLPGLWTCGLGHGRPEIVEPFSGAAGVIVPPRGYLQRRREICTQHDILRVSDEVITAFGRAGAWTGSRPSASRPTSRTSPSRSSTA